MSNLPDFSDKENKIVTCTDEEKAVINSVSATIESYRVFLAEIEKYQNKSKKMKSLTKKMNRCVDTLDKLYKRLLGGELSDNVRHIDGVLKKTSETARELLRENESLDKEVIVKMTAESRSLGSLSEYKGRLDAVLGCDTDFSRTMGSPKKRERK